MARAFLNKKLLRFHKPLQNNPKKKKPHKRNMVSKALIRSTQFPVGVQIRLRTTKSKGPFQGVPQHEGVRPPGPLQTQRGGRPRRKGQPWERRLGRKPCAVSELHERFLPRKRPLRNGNPPPGLRRREPGHHFEEGNLRNPTLARHGTLHEPIQLRFAPIPAKQFPPLPLTTQAFRPSTAEKT